MGKSIGRITLPRYTITNAVELAPLSDLIAQYLESECETPNTSRTYRTGLAQFIEFLSEDCRKRASALSYSDVTRVAIADYKKHRLATGKPSTAAIRLDTVKAFTAWTAKRYHLDDPAERVSYVPKGEIEFKGLSPQEVKKLLVKAKAEPDPIARFLPCFLLYTGTRIDCEGLNLKASQVDLPGLYLRSVFGKGSKLRHVPIDPEGIAEFDRYLSWHEAQRLGSNALLFPSPRHKRQKLSYAAARRMIAKYDTHPHALRHTYAHRFLDRAQKDGEDSFRAAIKLKRALGHSDMNTTLIYLGIQPGTFEQRYGMEMR